METGVRKLLDSLADLLGPTYDVANIGCGGANAAVWIRAITQIDDVQESKPVTLDDCAARADFARMVADLRAEATLVAPRLAGRTQRARRRVHDCFLVFTQLERYLNLLDE